MRLDYIYHSGFAIETDDITVIIDYYKDSSEESPGKGIVHDYLLQKPGEIYVLSTHFHPDHFNHEVLTWKEKRPDIKYIFSKDILKHKRATATDAIYIGKGSHYEDACIRIKACGSTDSGISFLIELQNRLIFHAGDLNNWHWSEESTPQEIRKADGDFLAEVKYIQQKTSTLDLAMFPVDSRMGKDYMRGATQFIERIKTSVFAPMHFGEDYNGGNAFGPYAEARGCRFLTINHRGQHFEIP